MSVCKLFHKPTGGGKPQQEDEMIRIVAIRPNGLTTTAQKNTWLEAAEEVIRWHDDPFYSRDGIAKIFFSDGSQLEEHKISQLREDFAHGRIPR